MSVVLRIENLWKEYRLGVFGHGALFKDIQSWWARYRGKEDPNLPVDWESNGVRSQDHIWALQDVSLEVKKGEIVGIIGRNGAGKSPCSRFFPESRRPPRDRLKLRAGSPACWRWAPGFTPN